MADYNLGRARGTIDIDYDGGGARRAQADMAQTAAEAAALDAAMGRVNQQFDRNQKVVIASSEDIIRARGEVERLKKVYQEQQEAYVKGQKEVEDARTRARDAINDEVADVDKLREARIGLDRAEENAEHLRKRAASSLDEYQQKMAAVRHEVDKFNAAHIDASRGFRGMTRDAEVLGRTLEGLEEKMSGVARILGQITLFGLLGGGAGGSLFANMAGGMHVLVTAMAAVVEIGNAVIGVVALLPAVINAAVLGLGTLAVSMHGVGAALTSMGDTRKFVQAIKDMSPAAQQAMLTIQSFTESFRGARDVLQESLFAPIVADIQPLIQTWLPRLMNMGKTLANEFGQSFHQIFQYFQTTEAQASFQKFIQNMVAGFQAGRAAIQPLLEAWNKLAEVGSGLFPRIGTAIADIASKFNAWIQKTSQTGQLVDYLNKALDAFTNMGRTIRDLGFGLTSMFGVFESQSGSALETIANLAARFREWADSVSGQSAIFSFFSLIKTASESIRPALSLMGDSLAIIGRTMTELGIAVQPGLISFFESFKQSLQGLSPHVKSLAPAINEFLVAFGQTLQQVVLAIGPKLPELMQDMSEAFIAIMQVLPPMAAVFAEFLSHITPEQVVVFLGLLGALKLMIATGTALRGVMLALNIVMAANPIGLVVIAAGALAGAAYLIIQNWDQVKETMADVWDTITRSFGNAWNSAYQWGSNLISNITKGIQDAARSILEPAVDVVASLIPKTWLTKSPAERGPLNRVSPNQMGASVVRNFAEGMSGASSAVDSASYDIAGRTAAIGSGGSGSGQKFSSAGLSTASGGNVGEGRSGFDQWVNFITQDLSAWSNIFKQAFSLVEGIGNIVVNTARVVANLWDGGDNPLTQPGGLYGPPKPISQQEVPGVPSKHIPGVAPDQYGRDLGAGRANGQQDVPGVPRIGEGGQRRPPPPPADPAATAAATTTGELTVPLTQRSDGTWTSSDPTWATLIERESGGRNIPQGITDANGGPGSPNAAQGIFQITPETWRANGGEQFAPTPLGASPENQAIVAARVLGSDPGAWGWTRHPGEREDPALLQAGLRPSTSTAGAVLPGGIPSPVPTSSIPATRDSTNLGLASNSRGGAKPDLFLAHTQEGPWIDENDHSKGVRLGSGNAQDLASSMAGGGTSYNYYIDANTGQVVTGVDPSQASVGTGGVNQRAINAVIAGSGVQWTREEWLQRMPALQSFAKLAAESGVPLQNIEGNTNPNASGIGGHDWATEAGFPTDGHTDPGPNFPWDVVMGLAQQYAGGQDPGAQGVNTSNNIIPVGPAGPPADATGPSVPGIDPIVGPLALGAGGAAILARALAKRAAHVKALTGEPLLTKLEQQLSITPETPAERAAIAQAPPEKVPVALRQPVQTNLGGAQLPGGDSRGAPVGPNRQPTLTPQGTRPPLPQTEVTAPKPGGVPWEPPGTPPEALRTPRVSTPGGLPLPIPKNAPPAGATTPRVAPSAAAAGPEGLRARIQGIASVGGKVFGPMLSFLNGGAISYSIVADAVDKAEQEMIAEGYHYTTDGTFMGIPVLTGKQQIDSGAVETSFADLTPEERAKLGIDEPPSLLGQLSGVEGRKPPSGSLSDQLAGTSSGRTPQQRDVNLANTEAASSDWTANPRSLANIPLSGTTTESVAAAGLAPLYKPGTTAIPSEIQELAGSFGLSAATRAGDSLHGAGFAFDITGAPEDMNRFADFVEQNLGSQTLELIHFNEKTGQKWGIAGAKDVSDTGYFDPWYASHGTYGDNAHVHWATDVVPNRGPATSGPPSNWPTQGGLPNASRERRGLKPVAQGADTTSDLTQPSDDWMQVPDNWDLGTPIPPAIISENTGLTPEQVAGMPPMFYSARPGTVSNVVVPPDYAGPYPVSPGGTISVPTNVGVTPGFSSTNNQSSPIDQVTGGMAAMSSVAGSAFQVFDDVIASITATANITRTLVRGPETSEDVVGLVQNFQQYIKTASSIAKLVSDVGGVVAQLGAIGNADPTSAGGTVSAVGGAIQAIAGIVQSAFDIANSVVTIGIDVYHQVGKYAGFMAGINIGGENTGPLGGNVRMLLNTNTNELMTYGEENPLNKNTFALPRWQQSYDKPAPIPQLAPMVNIYTGPGQTPREMMSESMWLIGSGAPSVASVAGAD